MYNIKWNIKFNYNNVEKFILNKIKFFKKALSNINYNFIETSSSTRKSSLKYKREREKKIFNELKVMNDMVEWAIILLLFIEDFNEIAGSKMKNRSKYILQVVME